MEQIIAECRAKLLDGIPIKINNREVIDQSAFDDKFFEVINRPNYLKAPFNEVINVVIDELITPRISEISLYRNQEMQLDSNILEFEISRCMGV